MSGHTPGPWVLIPGGIGVYSEPLHRITKIEGDDGVVKDFREGLVALLYGHHDANHNYSLGANRALVAAAPEMYDALGDDASGRPFAELLRHAADRFDEAGGGPFADCLRQKADVVEAVLAKAGGAS